MGRRLIGRDAELALAERAVWGGPGAVLAGEAGAGKTALAAAVAGRDPAAARVAPVTWVVATEASRPIPFGALGALLPPDAATLHPAAVPQVVARRLKAAGATRLLVIDDAHLLDPHSASTVLTLVAGRAARVLVTVRTGAGASDAVTALWKDRLLERLDLDPLDRANTRALLADLLGGDVATTTVELLWRHSRGNPLYLTELVRGGVDTGRLRCDSGVWWWNGRAGVPPRLVELLRHRLDGLSAAGQQALDALALGEPLPYETLTALVPATAILELEEHALVTSDEQGGVVRVRFAHPLLAAVAEARLTPARRRTLTGRLRGAPADHVDLMRRASWEEACPDRPDVELLLAAADSVLLTDPRAAARLAEVAARHDPGPRAALALSKAHAELGDPPAARAAVTAAATRIRDGGDRLVVGFEDVAVAMWSERRPAEAVRALADLRERLAPGFASRFDSAAALLALFRGRTATALAHTAAALAGDPDDDTVVRALTVRVAALALADRPDESAATARQLLAAMAQRPVPTYRTGLAYALVALAQLPVAPGPADGMPGSSGRWPAPQPASDDEAGPAWPLLAGLRHHLAGDWPTALAALREAYVQQCRGEGLLRSEATAELVVVLAEAGRAGDAARLLADSPPDEVATVPGLRPWCAAAVAAAVARADPAARRVITARRVRPVRSAAGDAAIAAARQALSAGATAPALRYLADSARYGRADEAAALTAGLTPRSPLGQARAAEVRARAAGDPGLLLAAAEQHLGLGLLARAAELAERADAQHGTSRGPVPRGGRAAMARASRVAAVRHEARRGLGLPHPADAPANRLLTPRERQVAAMAATGMSDRDIAATLVLSVRTVESHLAASYRKLGVHSRAGLSPALDPVPGYGPTHRRGQG